MQEILFDSLSELDRLPIGAIAAGTTLRIGLRAAVSMAVEAMELLIINDCDGEKKRYPLEKVWSCGGYDRFEGSLSLSAGLYWYYFIFNSDGEVRCAGRSGADTIISEAEPPSWQMTVYDSDYTTPDWICGGAFYHIFVDRFHRGGTHPPKAGAVLRNDWGGLPVYLPDEKGEIKNNDFFGGDLEGIIEKLPYLHDLGISCIYLSPIFDACSNHKYDTGDYMKIDPMFGDEEVFRLLCEKASKLDIRIILDGVFNHTGSDSKYFNREGHYDSLGAYQSKESPYYSWYSFASWPEDYESWWGIKTLPQVNENSDSFKSLIFGEDGVIKKWLHLGAYGWRLDVADELPDEFLSNLRKTVKSAKSDALIIGEVWEDASNKTAYGERRSYLQGQQLDSVMNYPFKDAIISYVKGGNAQNICDVVERICENYPKPTLDCLMNGLGTHDTPRALTLLGGHEYSTRDERAYAKLSPREYSEAKEKLHLATILQFTLPGVPCIYYGDEAGLEGYEDPFNRRCFPWGMEDTELTNWYRLLLKMRRESPALAGGDYRSVRADGGVYSYTRVCTGQKLLVIINLGKEDISISDGRVLVSAGCSQTKNGIVVSPKGGAVIEIPRD